MKREKNDLLYLLWNKIQSATVFNAIFFIISQAYVETATDDEVSCWAELSSVFSIFILIRGASKLFVTFVKGFLEDKEPNHQITSLEPYWIFKTTFPGMKCLIIKPLFLIEPCVEQKVQKLKVKSFFFKNIIYVMTVSGHVGSVGKTHFPKVNISLKIIMLLPLRTLESINLNTFVQSKPLG